MKPIAARALTAGQVTAPLMLLSAPLSLWGGLDLASGSICDVSHPQHGVRIAGTIMAMRAARGSSSSSSALVEAVRRGTAPAGIILGSIDPILVIGSLVAADLYGVAVPILLLDPADWPLLIDGVEAALVANDETGSIHMAG